MFVRPKLVRSIPFWILLIGSLATIAVGAWLVVDKITLINSTITDGTATGVEVYGGQAWVTLGAAIVGAGLVGLVAALLVATLGSFVRETAEVEPVVETAPEDEFPAEEPAVLTTDATPVADVAAEPAAETTAQPTVTPVAEPEAERTPSR